MGEADDTRVLADEIRGIARLAGRRLREEARHDSDLSAPHLRVLSLLHQTPGQTGAELARAEGMRPQSMGAILGVLRERELVASQPDPDDGRRLRLTLTPAGRELLAAVRDARNDWLSERLRSELSPAERATVAEAMALLHRTLE